MNSTINSKNNLYIPSNIKTKTEFFKGFGVEELKRSLVLTVIVGVIFFFVYQNNDNIAMLVMAICISMGAGVAIFSKDERNQSMVDTMMHMIRFAQQQKKYEYRFIDNYREERY